MQHDDIVTGIHDGHVKLRVEPGFFIGAALCVGGTHLVKNRLDHLKVRVGPQPGRTFRCEPFDVPPERQVVGRSFVVTREKFDEGRGKGVAQNIRDIDPGPGRVVSNPMSCSRITASRRDGRDTPRRSARSRSEGSRSPGRRIPRRINSSTWRTTASASFSGMTG